ncbi:MAG: PP2C family protein-serine/threonine phosphatase [Candidatus Xenobia bacterium]
MRLSVKIVGALSVMLAITLALCVSVWKSTAQMHRTIESLTARQLADSREHAALQDGLRRLAAEHDHGFQQAADDLRAHLELPANRITRGGSELTALREGEQLQQTLVYFAAGAVLASVGLMLLGLRGVLTPLQRLVDVTRGIGRGDLLRRCDENRTDEFGELGRSLNQMVATLRQQLDELAEKHRMLESSSQALQRELALAAQVQAGLLPQKVDIPWLDFFAHVEPAREIGGDFYDVHRWVADEGRIGIVVGDVSGRGVPAALMMVLCMSMLREAAQAGWCEPVDILKLANRSIRGQFPDESRDHFVTACYLALEPHRLRLANAGHERPYLRSARDGSVRRLEERGLFLVLFEEVQYQEMEVELAAGDKIVLFTDGIIESRDADGAFFGEERLMALIQAHGARPCAELGNAVLDAVKQFHADSAPRDDVSIVVLEIRT